MTIGREQLDELRYGDVVRVTGWQGLTVEGQVGEGPDGDGLWLGSHCKLSGPDRAAFTAWTQKPRTTLTVISRAPVPCYVNHDRLEPMPGDVVRDEDNKLDTRAWRNDGSDSLRCWILLTAPSRFYRREDLPERLRLLVAGDTGHVVP